MKRVVISSLVRYNANTGGYNVGDCVKRALTIAFGEDYNDIARQLNQTRKESRSSQFNTDQNISVFLSKRGLHMTKMPNYDMTVSEFADAHPQGTYLIYCGKNVGKTKNGRSNHMLCIVDGDVYDSWDSMNTIVTHYCKVTGDARDFGTTNVDVIVPDIHDFVEQYLDQLQNKFPYGELRINEPDFEPVDSIEGIDNYMGTNRGGDSFEFRIYIQWIEGSFEPVRFYSPKYNVHKTFIVKMNPSQDIDTNLLNNKKRLKQRIYDWLYEIKKLIDDSENSKSIEVNPNYHGNRRKLMKLPEWARPLVSSFEEGKKSSWGDYPFTVYIDPLPGDPRAHEGSARVEGWTLTELKENLEAYRTNFLRAGYDY